VEDALLFPVAAHRQKNPPISGRFHLGIHEKSPPFLSLFYTKKAKKSSETKKPAQCA